MRAALYLRISRDDAGEGLGVERQEQDCRQLCVRHGWSVGQCYVDNDVSAFSGRHRPAYAALMTAVGDGSVDAVVSWAPERLHRSPRELEDFLELVERTGTRVETVKAGAWDVSSSHGRLVARMLGVVSRAESERTGERVSRAHQQAKAAGLWRGPIPYGMKPSDKPGMPVPDEGTAPLVRQMLERIVAGEALTRIATDLNAAGHRPRRGQSWTHTGVDRLLKSPALGGLLLVDDELQPAAFEGVVPASVWREAQSALARRPRGEKRRGAQQLSLLGGLLTCAEHGSVLHGGSAAHGATYTAGASRICSVGIKRAEADALIRDLVIARLLRDDARDLLQLNQRTSDSDEKIGDLKRRRDDITELLGQGLLGTTAARAQLERIAAELSAVELPPAPTVLRVESLVDPVAAWEAWTMPQRRSVLRLMFASLTVEHIGSGGGPRVNVRRVRVSWAR